MNPASRTPERFRKELVMRNRWASKQEALKKWLGEVATSPREQVRDYYEILAVAPLLVLAVFPGMLVDAGAVR
jgi:hypothetical protein